jgi:hypothetical protein
MKEDLKWIGIFTGAFIAGYELFRFAGQKVADVFDWVN